MSSRFNITEIKFPSVLGRSCAQIGLVAQASAGTLSSALGNLTASAAGQKAPISALLVNHDAIASLTPLASRSEPFGSVSAILNLEDMP